MKWHVETESFERESWREWFAFELVEGIAPPRGYGVAWASPVRKAHVFLPIGVNVIAAWLRRVWFTLLLGARPSYLERWLQTQARLADREGYERAIQDTQRQIEQRFGDEVRARLKPVSDAGGTVGPNELGDATAHATEREDWGDEERVLFIAAQELARRRGEAIFFACQDPRCAQQPILARVDGPGGFWLACFHKRRWIPDPPKGRQPHVSRRALARMGIH